MDQTIIPPTRPYAVTATFQSAGEVFATERFTIEVVGSLEPYAIGRARADESVYANDHIFDLEIVIALIPIDPKDPEPPPPSVAIRPICSRCGSDDISSDACARWDVERQAWYLSGTQHCKMCGSCGADCDDLARWIPARSYSDKDEFLWAVIADLQTPSLAHSIEFQFFCVIVHGTVTVEQAAADWRARKATA